MMRIAAIDMGTNSFHLMVADVLADGSVQTVEKARAQVMLGSGGMAQHRITPEAWSRGLEALARFAETAEHLGAEEIHTAATSAVREARNGPEFCRAVKAETGIHVRVVTGPDEARLIWLGARADLDVSRGPVLLFDLGGGSTELILGSAEGLLEARSLPIGHIRLADRFQRSDPMGTDERRAIRRHVRTLLAPLVPVIRPERVGTLVGTSGTIRCLARMATLARGEEVPAHDHGLVLRRPDLETLLEQFERLTRDAIVQLPGMDAKRRDTLPAGAVVVREVMRAFEVDSLVTSERSLRDGLVVDWIEHHRPELLVDARVHDPRERSIRVSMERFGVDVAHAEHVAHLSLAVFDGTAPAHRLGAHERELLRAAALLHDIGHHISPKSHHKHGHYLLQHIRMWGFTAPEVAMLATLVRYHTRSMPKPTHPEWKALSGEDQARARVLAGILRLADALDRGHAHAVDGLRVELDDDEVRVVAHADEGGDLERWSARERTELLARALGIPVAVQLERGTPSQDET
ncbi:MAG: Ppx/GppA family phosphatase [Alphaproteobacteria bacterium]|nr:Ppx/GppA family phosphatase [Alphaproteobacteria bacterium]